MLLAVNVAIAVAVAAAVSAAVADSVAVLLVGSRTRAQATKHRFIQLKPFEQATNSQFGNKGTQGIHPAQDLHHG